MATPDVLKVGDTIGRHRLEERLGRCAMGEIWIAYSTMANKRVLTKFVLRPRQDELQRFEDEAAKLGQVSPDGYCYTDGGWEGGRTSYLVAEFPNMGNGALDPLVQYLELAALDAPVHFPPGDPNFVDSKVAMYAQAAVIFQMLTGRLPYPTSPTDEAEVRAAYQRIPPPLQDIMAKALDPNPANSFNSPGLFAVAMRSVVAPAPQTAPAPVQPFTAPTQAQPRPPVAPQNGMAIQPVPMQQMQPMPLQQQQMMPLQPQMQPVARPMQPYPVQQPRPVQPAPQPRQAAQPAGLKPTPSQPLIKDTPDRTVDTVFLVMIGITWGAFIMVLTLSIVRGFQPF